MTAGYVGIGLGTWYLVAPFLWGYPFGFLWWHSLLIGAAALAISLSFTLGPGRLAGWGLIALGAYSLFSPFLHGYLFPSFAFWNDVVLGVVLVGTGTAMGAAGMELAAARRQL